MNVFYKVINKINIGNKHKKTFIRMTANKNEFNFLKILIKLNKIQLVKKVNYNNILIILNSESKWNVKNFAKKKKTIKKSLKPIKDILIISNDRGLNLMSPNKVRFGVIAAKIYL